MAYQSTFTANLQPLEQAIKGATPTLNNFEQRTRTVGASLQRMVSEFDGTKLIQQATLLVGSIEKIGGASKLTEAEQRRVNSTIDAALQKYRVLGQEAPRSLTDLFTATKKVEAATSGLDRGLRTVGTIAAGAFAGFTLTRVVSEVGQFVSKTIEAGGRITDLSAKLGVSTTAIQRWEFAAAQNGNTVEQLVGAVTQLSKRLVDGDTSAVAAFGQLGLNVRELRALAPEQAFEAVATAIAKVPDPMGQSALAMAAFGRSGAEILPTIKADLQKVGDEAQRLGLVLDAETIAAMDDLGDAIGNLSKAGQGLLAQAFKPLVPVLNDIAAGLLDIARTKGPGVVSFFDGLQRRVLETTIAQAEFFRGIVEFGSKVPIFGKLSSAEEDLKKLDASIFGAKVALLTLGTSAETAGRKIEQTRKPVIDLGRASGAAAAAAKKLQDATDAFFGRDLIARANALVAIYEANNRQLPPTIELQKRVNDALAAAGEITTTVTPAFRELYINTFGAAVPTLQGFPQYLFDIGRAAESQAAPVAVLTARLKELNDVRTGLPSTLPGQKVDTTIPAPAPRVGDRIAEIFGPEFGNQLGSGIIQALAGGGSVTDTVSSIVGQALGKKLGQALGKSLARSLGESAGKLVGDVVGVIAGEAVGQVIGLGFNKLLKSESKGVNDVRDLFVLGAGGLAELNRQAVLAGTTLTKFLKADTVKEYNVAIVELQRAFEVLEARVKTTVGSIGAAGASGGFLGRDLAKEILSLKDRPEIREALGSFLGGQQDRTIGGLDTFLQNSLISSASSARALEGAILSQFGALTAAGASPLEAIQRLQPAIETFGQRTKEVVGFEASGAFRGLQTTVTLLTDAVAGPALTAVGGLGNVMVGLQNQGLLTQEVFGGLARQTFDTFHGLELLGQGGVDAARAMQQPLQRTWELVQDFGFSVDDDTKKLLDFAESSGLIGDQFRPAADKMALGIDRLIGKLDEFVTRLSGPLVNTAYDAARGIEKALNGITPDPIQIDIELVGAGLSGVPGFKHGTDGLVDFGRGTLAVLHGREAVLTEGQLNALAAASQAGTQVTVIVGEERYTSTMLRGARNVLRLQ